VGTNVSSPGIGLSIAASDSTIAGLAIGNFDSCGIELIGSGCVSNRIEGCFIGTDATGSSANPNSRGVFAWQNSISNRIGGTAPSAANLISGNGTGVYAEDCRGMVVSANYVGPDATLSYSLSTNSTGITITGGADNLIGGSCVSERNVICGNGTGVSAGHGCRMIGNYVGVSGNGTTPLPNNDGVSTSGVLGEPGAPPNVVSGNTRSGVRLGGGGIVQNNFIGTDATGSSAVPNGGDGIWMMNAGGVRIGGTSTSAWNVISGNSACGIRMVGNCNGNRIYGNLIGTDRSGQVAVPNAGSGIDSWTSGAENRYGTADAPNVISGNLGNGISITSSDRNTFQGNIIGATLDLAHGLPNGGNGIDIRTGSWWHQIGGPRQVDGNHVCYNAGHGLVTDSSENVLENNVFSFNGSNGVGHGVLLDEMSRGNTVRRNLFEGNAGAGLTRAIEVKDAFNQWVCNSFIDNRFRDNTLGGCVVTSYFFQGWDETNAPVDCWYHDVCDPVSAPTAGISAAHHDVPVVGGYASFVAEVPVPATSGTYVSYSREARDGGGTDPFTDGFLFEHVDVDWDAMPDAWEIEYFLSTNAVDGGPEEDWDKDGVCNRDEYVAGTSPTNDSDSLEIAEILPAVTNGDSVVLTWDSVLGCSYTVRTTTNLLSAWTNVNDSAYADVSGTGFPISYTNTEQETARRFFCIQARREEYPY